MDELRALWFLGARKMKASCRDFERPFAMDRRDRAGCLDRFALIALNRLERFKSISRTFEDVV
ncbi:hypothetical protein ACMHYB_60895 [Sorangium sp. So ce1128]